MSERIDTRTLGVSRVFTGRWLVGLTGSRSFERGYLTEPYKIVSVSDARTGAPVGELTEKRPSTRRRSGLLASSVNHFATDLLYVTGRYYWDSWDVRSGTLDLRSRHELEDHAYFEPHLRIYGQSSARFFSFGLVQGAPLPAHATSDYRLGPLRTVTWGKPTDSA